MFKLSIIFADSPIDYSYGFQDPGSDWMLGIIHLHDTIIFYLLVIFVVVIWFLASALLNKDYLFYLHHGNLIELIWTITPAMILWIIGVPSIKLLYIMDEILDAEITVKAIGNSWYWTYEYSDYVFSNGESDTEGITFDSFLVGESDLEQGDLRQLTVDNYLVLPVNTSIRLVTTSNDVIHNFAIPSLGLKLDAIPGRLNTTGLVINRDAVFYGNCSELCGYGHAFMPTAIRAVSLGSYLSFIDSYLIQS